MDFLPYSRPLLDDDDIAAVVEAMRDPVISQGARLAAFESEFAASAGTSRAVGFSSGTAALHGMCAAFGLGPGDEVILPALTFAGTANAVRYTGATPVFADIDASTLCLDPDAVRNVLTRRTKAVLTVDFAGHPSPYDPLRALADAHGLLLLADAAHAPGATYRGRPVGSIADATAFSLNPVKNLTAAEGGMVTTDNADAAERLAEFRGHGMTKSPQRLHRPSPGDWYYEQVRLGFNYKLSELHAALGRSQLEKLHRHNRIRRERAARYDKLCAGLPLRLPQEAPGVQHVYHLYVVRLLTGGPAARAELFAFLRDRGLGVQVHYIPVPLHPDYAALGYSLDALPETRRYYDEALSVPLHPAMSERDQDRVVDALSTFFDRRSSADGAQ